MKTLQTIGIKLSLLLLLAAGLLTSCSQGSTLSFQGTRPGALAAIRGVGLAASSATSVTLPVYSTASSQVGTLTLSDVRVALKEIKIKTASRTSDDDNIKFQGPYIVDLLSNSVSPSLPSIQLAAGTYDEIEMKLAKLEGSDVDSADPLFGNSIYIAGTYSGATASGTVTDMPFQFSYDLDETFELTGSGGSAEGFAVDASNAVPIIVAFRLRKWFSFDDTSVNNNAKEFSSVVVQSSQINLNKDSGGINADLRQVVRDLIKKSADYGRDSDSDGVLEQSEDDDPESEDADDN
jgi:hypothetical protein